MKKLFLVILLMTTAPAIAATEIPVEDFAALPVIMQPAVSPDGSKIAAMVRNADGYYDIMVTPFGKSDFTVVASLTKAYDRIEWIHWANNKRLLVAASKPANISRFKFRVDKLYSIDVETGENIPLWYREPTQNLRSAERLAMRDDANVVSYLPDDPDHILVEVRTLVDTGPAVFKVNINENKFEKIVYNDLHVYSWFANRKGEVLLGIGINPEERRNDRLRRFWYRTTPESDWKLLREIEIGADETFYPVGQVDDSGRILVISDYKIGRQGLYRYNVLTGEFEDLVFAPERYDLNDVITIDDRVVGVTWRGDYVEQHYFSEEDAKLSQLVEKTFLGAEVFIASNDRDRKKLVIAAVRDDTPLKYFLLDLEKGSASFWYSQYPQLEKAPLVGKRPFEYKARDGMPLNGYLTLPETEGDELPPLIVMPHGGPWARDMRYFDYMAQLFANRGYAVLQPNFRGSTGFGTAYEVAGYKEWGGKMQDDVIDAIAWVKEQGLADTGNMCLVGWSYGGYVALEASVQTPEMFDCFVSIAGVTDLEKRVVDNGKFYGNDQNLAIVIGDVEVEEDVLAMRKHSPVNFVKNVKRPILLIHGTEDTRVKYQQSEAFYEKAERLGKDVELILQDEGTHFLDYGPHRLEAFEAIDEFLAEHLD